MLPSEFNISLSIVSSLLKAVWPVGSMLPGKLPVRSASFSCGLSLRSSDSTRWNAGESGHRMRWRIPRDSFVFCVTRVYMYLSVRMHRPKAAQYSSGSVERSGGVRMRSWSSVVASKSLNKLAIRLRVCSFRQFALEIAVQLGIVEACSQSKIGSDRSANGVPRKSDYGLVEWVTSVLPCTMERLILQSNKPDHSTGLNPLQLRLARTCHGQPNCAASDRPLQAKIMS